MGTDSLFNLTDEQKEVVSTDLQKGSVLKVIAFAGTGKTTTLVRYTNARPEKKFLYVAFNKAVENEARKTFPSNVTCKTAHALAFPSHGAQYRDRIVSEFRSYAVKKALKLNSLEVAQATIDTLTGYLASSDPEITGNHIPSSFKKNGDTNKGKLVFYANLLKLLMYNGKNNSIGMLHDGYLKEFQLSRPTLDYDVILVDEAQDLNPVTTSILLSQACPKIFVGDPHQQIYSFRGAVNTLNSITAVKTAYLTQSFRFTPQIAYLASTLLHYFKGETKQIAGLRHLEKPASPLTIIARTNATLFEEAISLCQQKKSFGFIGNVNTYPFFRIIDTYYLGSKLNDQIKDPLLKSFLSIGEMEKYGEEANDLEIKNLCRIFHKYGDEIPLLLHNIKNQASTTPEYNLTTAHKAKGLQWPQVYLSNDYLPLVKSGRIVDLTKLNYEEINILYVAITRGMFSVFFSSSHSLATFFKIMALKKGAIL